VEYAQINGTEAQMAQLTYLLSAHCLLRDNKPRLPALHGEPGWDWDTTYQKLLAPLGGEPAAWAECLFVDPVGDIAVLGSPDNQALWEQADAYGEFVDAEEVTPLTISALEKTGVEPATLVAKDGKLIGDPATLFATSDGWVLSLKEMTLRRCTIKTGKPLSPLAVIKGKIVGGMSGSPILSGQGRGDRSRERREWS
jgi:hypothetical protein